MILFADSSVLIKLYIAEPGSEPMREATTHGDSVTASRLAFAEIHATFARRRREGHLLSSEFEELRRRFGEDWEELTQVPIGAEDPRTLYAGTSTRGFYTVTLTR